MNRGTRSPGRGTDAEDRAAGYVASLGYSVLARNFATRAGEIDIVARDGASIVFIEVRARASASHGAAVESISPAKRRRVVAAARLFAARHRLGEAPMRFDVISIDGVGASATLRHDRGAFAASG